MAWLPTASVEVPQREGYYWRYQYATYKNGGANLPGTIDIGDPQEGDEVARRIKERVQSTKFVGMTVTAARSQASTLSDTDSYRNVRAVRANEADGWEVIAQKVEQHPDGWSAWKLVSDFDAWSV